MNVNRRILFSGFIITSTGIIRASQGKNDYTSVLVGGYVFILIMAILDAFGGTASKIAGMLALLAALYVVIDKFPWDVVINLIQGNNKNGNR